MADNNRALEEGQGKETARLTLAEPVIMSVTEGKDAKIDEVIPWI
jgi:hypothetical protein